MQAVTHARASRLRLDGRDVAVAVVVSRRRIVEDADRCDDRAVHLELDYLVTVLRFSAISVVHLICSFVVVAPEPPHGAKGAGARHSQIRPSLVRAFAHADVSH